MLGGAGIAFLVGMFSEQAVLKLRQIAEAVLTGAQQGRNRTAAGATAAAPKTNPVSPATGPLAGGTEITIKASGFTGKPEVLLGGVAATEVKVQDETTLTAKTPRGPSAGPVDLVVKVADKVVLEAKGAFTYTS